MVDRGCCKNRLDKKLVHAILLAFAIHLPISVVSFADWPRNMGTQGHQNRPPGTRRRTVRATTLLLGAALNLALVLPAGAQQSAGTTFMSGFNGVNPRNINMVKIDTNKAMKNLNINNAFRTPAPAKPFSLATIFPRVHLPSWPPAIASAPILGQQNNPFQPNPIPGKNPFGQTPTK
jgi:hypothetical protein